MRDQLSVYVSVCVCVYVYVYVCVSVYVNVYRRSNGFLDNLFSKFQKFNLNWFFCYKKKH